MGGSPELFVGSTTGPSLPPRLRHPCTPFISLLPSLSFALPPRQAGAFRLAPDCRLPRDGLAGTRLAQMLELAAFVRARGAGATAGVVLAGDLNSAPDTLEYTVLKASGWPCCAGAMAGSGGECLCGAPRWLQNLLATGQQALLPELRDAWADACPLLLGATSNALENSFWGEERGFIWQRVWSWQRPVCALPPAAHHVQGGYAGPCDCWRSI